MKNFEENSTLSKDHFPQTNVINIPYQLNRRMQLSTTNEEILMSENSFAVK